MGSTPIISTENNRIGRGGGTGRRAGLKIQLWRHSAGSIPARGTSYAGIV